MSVSSLGSSDVENENSTGNANIPHNFWDLREYYRTVKRVENANKLCSELCALIHERAEIERTYMGQLKRWSAKWETFLQTGPEYGTTQKAWLAFCIEASKLADVHQERRRRLVEEVEVEVRNWQKEHFHKATLPPQSLKEAKTLENEFDAAQKPWAKRYKRTMQTKKDYHSASRTVIGYQNQLNTDAANGATDQEKKIRDKLTKAERDKDKALQCYQNSLNETDSDKGRYIDEMHKVFEKSQQAEEERLEFFKTIFSHLSEVLNPLSEPQLPKIYADLNGELSRINIEGDLRWWSDTYGAGMEIHPPEFEEYNPDQLNTHSSGSSSSTRRKGTNRFSFISTSSCSPPSATVDAGNITIPSPSEGSVHQLSSAMSTSQLQCRLSHGSASEDSSAPNSATLASPSEGAYSDLCESNGKGKSEDDTCRSVKALYDYDGQEEDELTFVAGDTFIKLSDEDQGWSRGVKDGKVGLFPTSYVEEV